MASDLSPRFWAVEAAEPVATKRGPYKKRQPEIFKLTHYPADMTLDNLAKVTIFLARRSDAMENRAIRQEVLGERTPALTAIVTGIFDERWLIELEAIAAG